MDKFSEFQTFLEVAQEGSFSRAADGLGITPSAVSKQIHAVYPHRKHLFAKVRQFVDHLAAHYGPRPYWDEGLPV